MSNIHLDRFIQSLSPKEIRVIEDHISSISALSGNPDESKQLKYFRHVLESKGKEINPKEISSVGSSNLSSLKYHLSEKMYDALILTKHLQDENIFNLHDQIIFYLKKKILLAKTLLRTQNQGRTETIDVLLSEIIKQAKENEVYDVLVEALTTQKYFKGIRHGIKDFDYINQEINFYDYCSKANSFSNDCYYKLILNNEFINSLSTSERLKHLEVSIHKMKEDFSKTKSQQINYYLHLLQLEVFQQQKNFSLATSHCKKLIVLLKKNKVIYRKDRLGIALINLCHFNVFAGKYQEGAKNALAGQKYYLHNSFNFIIAKEQELYAYFYGGIYKKASSCAEELLEHSLSDTGEFRKSKFVYYQACIFFATKQYKEALQLLNKSLEIEKDKARWNVSLRILNIMIYIELNKINEASRSLESLRKYMERTTKEDNIKPRDILIVKLLRELEKDGFEFLSKNSNVANAFKQLSSSKEYAWEHYTSELIPFHHWLETKKRNG